MALGPLKVNPPEDQKILGLMNEMQKLHDRNLVWDRDSSGQFFATKYQDSNLARVIHRAVIDHEAESSIPLKPKEVFWVEDFKPADHALMASNASDHEQLRKYRSKLKAALPAAWKKGEPLKQMSKKTALQKQLQEPPSLQAIHPSSDRSTQDVAKDHQPTDPSPASGDSINHPTKSSTSVSMRPEHLIQLAKAAADEKKRKANEKRLATRKKNKVERKEKTRKVEFLLQELEDIRNKYADKVLGERLDAFRSIFLDVTGHEQGRQELRSKGKRKDKDLEKETERGDTYGLEGVIAGLEGCKV